MANLTTALPHPRLPVMDDPMGYRAAFGNAVRALIDATVKRRLQWRIVNQTTAVCGPASNALAIQTVPHEGRPSFVLHGGGDVAGTGPLVSLKSWERPELDALLDQLYEQATRLAARTAKEEAERKVNEQGLAFLRGILGE